MRDSQLVERFREQAELLPDWLHRHVERVVVEGRRLAQRYALAEDELNLARIEAACWGHDLYRAHEPAQLLALAEELRFAHLQRRAVRPDLAARTDRGDARRARMGR